MVNEPPETIRRKVRVSKANAARLAGVSLPTLTIYEIAPERIGPKKRPALDRIYRAFVLLADAALEARTG